MRPMAEVGHPRVTIREVADEAGVSIATVSRVLNGRDDVAPETRELVSRVIQQRGYVANRSARGLSAGRTGLVGVVVPLVFPVYFSAILSGASEALYEHDLRVVLSPTGHEHDREVTLVDRLMHGLTDGALIVLPEESSSELQRLVDAGYHFVVVDPRLRLDDSIPSVSAAHTSGADQAMRHLLSLGHRRIAAITGPDGWVATEDRRRGYHAALAAAGILPDPALEVESDFEIAGGARATSQLLDLPDPPTAVFAFNDNLAIGAVQAARTRGVRVPEDLSVVGFDDSEHATIVTPALTTVRQPLAEMGRTAVSLLSRLLDRQRFETLHIELATRLVVRSSTAPPAR
jgi:LacI family transcriptional regulator, galactose operon repressor